MTMQTLFTSRGLPITIGVLLGRGGEGAVHESGSHPGYVAKLYHQAPDSDKASKLSQMVALKTDRLLRLAAWPVARGEERG